MNIKRCYRNNVDEAKSILNSVPIDRMSDGSLSEAPEEIENDLVPDKIVNRLTALVRKQYYAYLRKLLKQNYQAWCHQELGFLEEPSEDWIKSCASLYEEKAAKSCMIVQFYRKSMLKTIANIRRDTMHGKLAHKLKEFKDDAENLETILPRTVDAFTQTEEEKREFEIFAQNNKEDFSLSLEEKIDFFQKRLEAEEVHAKQLNDMRIKNRTPRKRKISNSSDREKKHKRHHFDQKKKLNSPIRSPQLTPCTLEVQNVSAVKKDTEDEVAKGLEELFGGTKNDIDDIFGEGSCDHQINQILKEIEQAKLPGEIKNSIKDSNDIHDKQKEPVKSKKGPPPDSINILCESIWPCELHMRMQRLRQVLSGVADRGIRCHDKIKHQFTELFGEDSDDEFGVYSPTLELNEVLLASCKKRIAPWVVKHLMQPMKEGLIGNRILFKKLAKNLATKIVLENQYPDENLIKRTVKEYFCFHQRILSIEDIMP